MFSTIRQAFWSKYRLLQELKTTEKQNFELMAEAHQYSLMWEQFESVQDDLMGEVKKMRRKLKAQKIMLEALGQIEESKHESGCRD